MPVSENNDVAEVLKRIRGRLPYILDADGKHIVAISALLDTSRLHDDIGSQLSFAAFPILSQIYDQRYQSAEGENGLGNHNPEHRAGPIGHALLSNDVPLLALFALFPIGIALLGHLIRKAVDSNNGVWAIVGGVSALLGAALIDTGITGLLGG